MSAPSSRRDILKLALGAGLATAFSTKRVSAEPKAKSGSRYFLFIFAHGGIDAVFSADPKTRAQVEPWVDVPYASKDIVTAGDIQLGPHFAPLASAASRLALINGVQTGTANHITGMAQFIRLRTRVEPRMSTIHDIIGQYRDTQTMGTFECNSWFKNDFDNPAPMGSVPGPLYQLESAPAEDLLVMAAATRHQATRLRNVSPATTDQLDQAAAFFERVPTLPKFVEERWSPVVQAQVVARSFQRAAWVFQHDVARCVYTRFIGSPSPWDSHNFNTERQATVNAWTLPMLSRLLQMLEKTSNRYGRLIDNTTIVFGSDLGRFPRLNGMQGKDHYPEIPLLLCGAGLNTGSSGAVYGATDRRMASMPISLRTGRAERGGHQLSLDDIGATLLHVAGIKDPSVHGYTGKILPFLA